MANNSANVSTGKPKTTGGVWWCPDGTVTLPTDATTSLSTSFSCLGYISEDGVTEACDISSASIIAWGGDTVDTAQQGKTYTYSFTPIEVMNIDVLKMMYGANNVSQVGTTGVITVNGTSDEVPSGVFVIELALKDGAYGRIVIPNGKLTSIGDVAYNDSDPIGGECEITANTDSSGKAWYKYFLPAA